jgi:hypothetical protein
VTVSGAMATWATGILVVIVAVPIIPSDLAEIVAVPRLTAVTSPLPDTWSTVESLVAHWTVRVSACPSASRGVATSCNVNPIDTAAVAGDTSTVATAGSGGVDPSPPHPWSVASSTTTSRADGGVRQETRWLQGKGR